MTLFGVPLKWDSLTLIKQSLETLRKRGWKDEDNKELEIEFGMSDSGKSCFSLHAYKGKKAIRIIAENDNEKLHISSATNPSKKAPVENIKTFEYDLNQLPEASKDFEELLDLCDGIIKCDVPYTEREMAREELEDRLKKNRKMISRDFVEKQIKSMIEEGYNITLEQGLQYAVNWGAKL